MLTDWGTAGLGLVSGVLAARLLGPRGEGELAAIQTWPSFMATVAMLGIPSALAYYSAREPTVAGRWLSTAIVLGFAGCVPFAIVGYFVMPWLLSSQTTAIIAGARAYLWLFPILALVGMLVHPLRGRNDLVAWNLLRPLPTVMSRSARIQ
jgi:O-antigen/teichoic acid export membrane protein